MTTSDELRNYVQKYKEGDSKAFEDIYRMSYAYLHTCIMHMVKDEDAAQDMLQETYMEISRSIEQLKDLNNFLSWAAVIANRKCLALLKKKNSELLVQEDDWDDKELLEKIADNEEFIPESLMENQEKQRLMMEIIDGLTDMQRLCVIGFYYNELSQEEIAEELGIPVNTVKSHLNRAKVKIKDAVVELDEKKGTRLYSLAPFMLLLLGAEVEACNVPAMADDFLRELGIKVSESQTNDTKKEKTSVKFSKFKLFGALGILGFAAAVGIVWMITSNKSDEEETTLVDSSDEFIETQPEADIQEESETQPEADLEESEEKSEINLKELLVIDDTYESYGNAYGGSIPVKKDGMWGAVNYDNQVIVPCEYTGFFAAPDKMGNFVLYNSVITEETRDLSAFGGEPIVITNESREYFLFDNQGNIIYQGEDEVRASGGMYITLHIGDESAVIDYHSLDGTVLISEECDVSEARINGFYDGISNLYSSLGTEIYVDMSGADGMGPFEDDVIPRIGSVDLQGTLSWREDPYYYIWWDDINESIAHILESNSNAENNQVISNATGASSFIGRGLISTMNNGCYVTGSDYIESGYLTAYDEEDNKIAEFNYWNLSADENGDVNISESTFNEMNGYRGFYVDGVSFYNYGSRMVFSVDNKNVLIDFARNTNGDEILNADEVVIAVYDYIAMANETYWLVKSGEESGYIDHDGNEMEMFRDASGFVNGYALVIEDGEVWLIDETFNKLQSLGQADSVSALGELYGVTVGDEMHVYQL